jgi:hypothetical protein
MKRILKTMLVAAIALGFTSYSHALSITPASTPVFTGTNTSNLDAQEISAIVGTTVSEVYKQDVGDPDSGDFADSYETTFSNEPNDPQDALIDYLGGASITGGSIYLYVKDGNATPAYYIFDITGWNGTDDITLTGFWPDNGAISHVTILSGAGRPDERVPDGGTTVAMLGLAFAGLGGMRRFLKR